MKGDTVIRVAFGVCFALGLFAASHAQQIITSSAGIPGFTSDGTTLSGSGQTITTSAPILDLSQTWNNAGTTFTGASINIIDTASNSNSSAFSVGFGGTAYFKIRKATNGTIESLGDGSGNIGSVAARWGTAWFFTSINAAGDSAIITLGAAQDVKLIRDGAANTLAQRNGTTAQTKRVYNTFTDASNYERAVIDWGTTANVATIGAEAAGTGVVRPVKIVGAGVGINVSGLTLTPGALAFPKITASASAPGAAGAKLELVCGTNAGTAKLVIAAGTSATVVTIVDNIGAGVSGC